MNVKDKMIHKGQFLFLIGVLALLIAAGGTIYYRYQANSIRKEKHSELQAIASLKISQLVQWRKERMADARVYSSAPFFTFEVEQWFRNTTNKALKEDLRKRITIPQKENEYQSIFLVSTKGEILLSTGTTLDSFDTAAHTKIVNAAKFDSVTSSDFYYCKTENTIHYDIIAPLKNKMNRTIALLVFRINPYDYLYPLIQSWPTFSKTSETLLIRRDGDSVLFLNELRFRADAALFLRIPLTQKEIPAVQSVLGYEGIFDGKDYRGTEVLADIRSVPGTPWYIIAKVDRAEMLSDLYEQAVIIAVLTGILILLCITGLMWIYHYRQRNIYRTMWQTQEEFRMTLYSIGDAVITTDKNGRVQHVNAVAEQLTGWKEFEARNKPIEEVFHIVNEDTKIRIENPVQMVLQKGQIVGLANHTLLISKDRREIPIADSGSPIRGDKDEIIGVVLVFRDQTKERANQKLIQDSEAKYRRLFEAARDGILILNAETGRIVDVNPFLIEMLGYTHEYFLGKYVWDLGFLRDIVANEQKFSELRQKEFIRYENMPLETFDGRRMEVEFVSNVYLVNHHKVIQCNIRDITDRKRAEEAVRQKEKHLRQFYDSGLIGVIYWNMNGQITDANNKFLEMVGYTRDDLIAGRIDWAHMTPPEFQHVDESSIEELKAIGVNRKPFEKEYIHKDGKRIPIILAGAMLDEVRLNGVAFVLDITERKQVEEALKESARKLNEVQKIAQLGNWIWDVRTGDVEWSDEVFKIFRLDPKEFTPQIESILELSPWKDDHERDKELIRRAMESHERGNYEQRFLRPDKSVGYYYSTFEGKYDDSGNLLSIVGTVQDITERKQMEEGLRNMQKMEGLGTLAGGIAHDFNNILGIILAYITSMKMFKEDAKKFDVAAETIVKAVNRGKTLVQQILTFARKTETSFGAVNVNDVVMEIMSMLLETFPKSLTYAQNFEKGIPWINADRSQIYQVLLNLSVNARDAMSSGGVLTINTSMVSVAQLRTQHPDASASGYVCIEVIDTGEGMTEEVRSRIFEPFFTTKGIGKGTGLGLSVVFGVIQSHRGFIDVESEVGKGTTFRIYLPASQTAAPVSVSEKEETLEEITGGTETILVVEDEEMLMISVRMVLEEKGYTVLTAGDGLTALKLYQERKNNISLVMTDLGLPGMTGLEVGQRIKKIKPNEHVILATGFLDPDTKSEFLKAGIDHFLYKPYDLVNVLKTIRAVLDGK